MNNNQGASAKAKQTNTTTNQGSCLQGYDSVEAALAASQGQVFLGVVASDEAEADIVYESMTEQVGLKQALPFQARIGADWVVGLFVSDVSTAKNANKFFTGLRETGLQNFLPSREMVDSLLDSLIEHAENQAS